MVDSSMSGSMASTVDTLERIFELQRKVQQRVPYPAWPQRAAWLKALRALLRDNDARICEAISADFGCRPHEETRLLELFPSLGRSEERRVGVEWGDVLDV